MLDNLQKVINWAFAQRNEINILYNWSDMHQNWNDQDINLSIFHKWRSYACERGNGLWRLWRRCLWSGSWRQKMVRAASICKDVRRKHQEEWGQCQCTGRVCLSKTRIEYHQKSKPCCARDRQRGWQLL